jgi:DNA helicase-4
MESFLRTTLPEYDQAMAAWKGAFGPGLYVTESARARWLQPYGALPGPSDVDAKVADLIPPDYRLVLDALARCLRDSRAWVDIWNDVFARAELRAWRAFFDCCEKHPLSAQQREAIVRDEDNALIVAGAGTGKTSTVAGKVGYVLRRGLATPDEVLLLAFTRKAAKELGDRVGQLFGAPVQVRTFHALGLEIIGAAEGRRPALCKEAESPKARRDTLDELVAELAAADPGFAWDLVNFQAYHRAPYRSAWEFESVGDYYAHLRDIELLSLKGEQLRSLEEVEIANFLTLHGVRYEYEAQYPVDTANPARRQYRPDFFLPDAGIYIEHFGVDEYDRPPPWFTDLDRRRYVADMEWKRGVHREHKTTLIETYSWQRRRGILLDALHGRLREAGVVLRPVSGHEVLADLNAAGVIEPVCELLGTFLSLFKSGGCTIEEVSDRVLAGPAGDRSRLFLRVFGAVHDRYEALLDSRGEIDFDDMIGRAAEHVRAGRYRSPFRYVVVDEFQDISRGRAGLIRALRDQVAGCRMFCVGDDWQSIYRFAGSDVSLMSRFGEHFGFTRQTLLETTFRFPDRLARFSSAFVLKNPAQLRKTLTTLKTDDRPPVTVYMTDGEADALPRVLGDIAKDAGPGPGPVTVAVLNRYNFQAKGDDYRRQLRRDFPTLDVTLLTAHAAKGLEADYVVVDNLRAGRYGFPTEVTDDPLLSLVLARPDEHPHAEERRLFYVALTRSRTRAALIADAGRPSCFVREILSDDAYEKVVVSNGDRTPDECPSCRAGQLVEREGRDRVFFGCSNFPRCSYSEDACPECRRGRTRRNPDLTTRCEVCGRGGRVCPGCRRGLLVPRTGPYGPFLGCTLFSADVNSCSHTESVFSPRC